MAVFGTYVSNIWQTWLRQQRRGKHVIVNTGEKTNICALTKMSDNLNKHRLTQNNYPVFWKHMAWILIRLNLRQRVGHMFVIDVTTKCPSPSPSISIAYVSNVVRHVVPYRKLKDIPSASQEDIDNLEELESRSAAPRSAACTVSRDCHVCVTCLPRVCHLCVTFFATCVSLVCHVFATCVSRVFHILVYHVTSNVYREGVTCVSRVFVWLTITLCIFVTIPFQFETLYAYSYLLIFFLVHVCV